MQMGFRMGRDQTRMVEPVNIYWLDLLSIVSWIMQKEIYAGGDLMCMNSTCGIEFEDALFSVSNLAVLSAALIPILK